jgi:predicted XRE-type DNA-binding protein
MKRREEESIRALRGDLALQIARHVARAGASQAAMAERLGIPQPTLSHIVRGRVEAISLELMLRVAIRAGLSVLLQTGRDPLEAGVYAANPAPCETTRTASRVADEARRATREGARPLTPEQRLAAHLRHNELVTALKRAGTRAAGKSRRSPA